MEFIECKICASKPGSPILCESCLQNRETISKLNRRIYDAEKLITMAIEIMTPEQIGKWEGVRKWQETA